MPWPYLNKNNANTATRFGVDALNKVLKFLSGINDPDGADINSQTRFYSGSLLINNLANTFRYIFNGSAITGNRNVTLPVLTNDDTFVFENHTQTVTNKTISGSNNTLSNIPKGAIPASVLYNDQNNSLGAFYQDLAQIAAPSNPSAGTRRVFVDSGTGKLSVRTSGGTTVSLEEQAGGSGSWDPNAAETLTNKTVAYGSNTLTDVVSTNTAQDITAAKTFDSSTAKFKNAAGTFAYTIVGGTITADKTLTLPTFTVSSDIIISQTASADFNGGTKTFRNTVLRTRNPANTFSYIFNGAAITANRNVTIPLIEGDDTFVMEAMAQTLINKTLTTPIIATVKPDASNSLNFPVTNDTLVALTLAQTLTNKTINGSNNTLSNIPKSAIPSSTIYNDQNNVFGAFYQDLAQIAAPANPASGTRRVFVDSSTGKLSVRTNAGTTVSLEEQGGGGWSPSATETLTNKTISAANNTLPDVAVAPNIKIDGGWYGGGVSAWSGYWQGLTATTVGTIAVVSDNLGKWLRATTGGVSGNGSGIRFADAHASVRMSLGATFKFKFKIDNTTAIRLYIGFHSSSTAFPTGETPLAAASGFAVTTRQLDSNYFIVHNNGGATATYVDTGVARAANTNVTIELVSVPASSGFRWSINGGALSSVITTPVPAQTTALYPVFHVETAAAAAKAASVQYLWVEYPQVA